MPLLAEKASSALEAGSAPLSPICPTIFVNFAPVGRESFKRFGGGVCSSFSKRLVIDSSFTKTFFSGGLFLSVLKGGGSVFRSFTAEILICSAGEGVIAQVL